MAALHHVYAVVDALPPHWRPPVAGVGGAVVQAGRLGDVVLVSSPVPAPPSRSFRMLAEHDDVLRTLMDADALLPLRAGTVVGDPEGWLAARHRAVRDGLEALRGSVEVAVRLLGLDGRVAGADLRGLADRLAERAARWPSRYQPAPRSVRAASLAFLVPRDEVTPLLARIAPVASRASGIAVVPTAPGPACSFAPSLLEPDAAVPGAAALAATG